MMAHRSRETELLPCFLALISVYRLALYLSFLQLTCSPSLTCSPFPFPTDAYSARRKTPRKTGSPRKTVPPQKRPSVQRKLQHSQARRHRAPEPMATGPRLQQCGRLLSTRCSLAATTTRKCAGPSGASLSGGID